MAMRRLIRSGLRLCRRLATSDLYLHRQQRIPVDSVAQIQTVTPATLHEVLIPVQATSQTNISCEVCKKNGHRKRHHYVVHPDSTIDNKRSLVKSLQRLKFSTNLPSVMLFSKFCEVNTSTRRSALRLLSGNIFLPRWYMLGVFVPSRRFRLVRP